jgi:hypothetical protein
MRRLTVTLDSVLEQALGEARERLGLRAEASDAEKLRAYARLGYERTLDAEFDAARLATYQAWADAGDMGRAPRVAFRRAVMHKDC